MAVVDPSLEQVVALTESAHEGPVQMINLLQFKPSGGLQSYERYIEAVQPHLDSVGGQIVAHGAARQMVIGEAERPWWDAIATVEYPSIAAFIQMVTSEGYQTIAHHRTNALARAELIAAAPGTLEAS
jgi:uncharacterized protein (DUF1330 family)